ncbi:MAG: hypothetical protein ACLPN5_21005 [Roseiarcus sp.]
MWAIFAGLFGVDCRASDRRLLLLGGARLDGIDHNRDRVELSSGSLSRSGSSSGPGPSVGGKSGRRVELGDGAKLRVPPRRLRWRACPTDGERGPK